MTNFLRGICLSILTLFATASLAGLPAQANPPGTGGLDGLARARIEARSPYRVLMIGAHPDDEDTELLTILSRGMGASVAYLSLTRGEGGQDLIGPQLGPGLGVLRSGELLAARKIDGGGQFFTRAYDFGFSKSAKESFQFWSHDSLLKDVVRTIRRFRPQVVISVWTGTPLDGHGHHQAAGILAREAYDIAGDSTKFPELLSEENLSAWAPAKFYRNRRASQGALVLDGGAIDSVSGFSFHQLAMRGRSQHRSQGMGQLQDLGPSQTSVALEATAPGIDFIPSDPIFSGIPVAHPSNQAARDAVRLLSAGVISDAFVTDNEVTPGQIVPITVITWNTGNDPVTVSSKVVPREGWVEVGTTATDSLTTPACKAKVKIASGQLFSCVMLMQVSTNASPDQPYFLKQERVGSMYHFVGDPANWGEAFGKQLSIATQFSWQDGGQATSKLAVTARSVDPGYGEVRRPVTIVPDILVKISPSRMLWPNDLPEREFEVTIEHPSQDPVDATVRLVVPEGWTSSVPQQVALSRENEMRVLHFVVSSPASVRSGEYQIRAEAITAGKTYRMAAERIIYPHVADRVIFSPAQLSVVVAPVAFARNLRTGYLRGAADAIPEALVASGVPFRLLNASELQGEVLDSLDVVVIGPRAYEVDDAVRRAHPSLLEFAQQGGTLITQYQQYQYVAGGYPPYPFTIARPHDRVTDETAPVRFLPAADELVNGPNKLSVRDFEGWVQERGLYFAGSWDSAWTPMMESHDPGEDPKLGGLLIANYGKGKVIYTGISFFRELPAAVPGAWRLFANLIGLGSSG